MTQRRKAQSAERRRYVVRTGLNYPNPDPKVAEERRAEPGDIVSDLPTRVVDDLLAIGAIEEVGQQADDE